MMKAIMGYRWNVFMSPAGPKTLPTGLVCKVSDFGLTRDVYIEQAYRKKSDGRSKCTYLFQLN